MENKTDRQGFVLYHNLRKPLEMLDDAQRGKLLLAIMDYSELGVVPDFDDPVIDMAFAFIRDRLDRDADAYKDKCEKRAIAGSKGGKQRVANQANATFAKQEQANEANASKSSQLKPKPEPKPKPESESKPKQGKKEHLSFTPPTLEEVTAYCRERNSTVDPRQFWEYFNVGHWMDSRGQPVHNWKQKLLTWEKMRDGTRSNPANAKAGAEKTFDIQYDVE